MALPSTNLIETLSKWVSRLAQQREIIDVTTLAERLRLQFETENIALEDIERMVVQAAAAHSVPMAFDSRSNGQIA